MAVVSSDHRTRVREPRLAPAPEGEGNASDGPREEATVAHVISIILAVVRRRWQLIAASSLLVIGPVIAYAAMAIPTYTAQGAVQVSASSGLGSANPLLEMMGSGAQGHVQTEVEIIRRHEFLSEVLRSLKLQIVDPDQPTLLTVDWAVITGASPVDDRLRRVRNAATVAEVPQARFEPTMLTLSMATEAKLRASIGEEEQQSVEFAVGELLDLPDLRLQFSAAPLAVGESVRLQILPVGTLIEQYEESIGVRTLGTIREPTNIVQISMTDTDRETAAAVVQTMMERYVAKTLEWQAKSASQAAEFIEGQLEEVRKNLRGAEDKMLSYSQQQHAVQLDTQARVAIENAAQLEAQRIAIQLQERTIGAVLTRIGSGSSPKASLTANFFDDPVLAQSIGTLTEAETRYEMMRASLTEQHPQVLEIKRGLDLQRQEVARLMKSAQRNLASQKKQIEDELTSATEAMAKYPDTQLELGRLTRDMEVSQRLYSLLLEKHEEAEIMKASTTTDKRIVDAASLPHRKAAPQRGKLAAFGAIGGLLLGIGVALGVHFLQRRLDTVEAVREIADFPTYGTVPEVARAEDAPRLTIADVWKNAHEALPEAFRALGVSVSLIPGEAARGKLIAVTSSQPGEGKSTMASNLAESLGRTGKRVLIVDLDLRKPVQHRLWGVPREPGYSDLVGQGGKAEDVLAIGHKLDAHSTTVLTAGTRLPDTVAAIMAPALEQLLERWAKMFDYVILDSPPAFVAETVALTRHTDLVLLVARPGVIERGNLRHAIEALSRIDVPKGLVLNAVGKKHTEYYYGSGYYYYGSTYGEDDKGTARAG